jgi:type IV secretory pathway VirB4 component
LFFKKSDRNNSIHLFNIAACTNNCLIDIEGVPTMGFKLTARDYYYKNEHSKLSLIQSITRVLNNLPSHTICSFYRIVTETNPTYMLFITKPNKRSVSLINLAKMLPQLFFSFENKECSIDTNWFNAIYEQLSSLGIELTPLKEDPLLNWHRTILSQPRRLYNKAYTFRSQCLDDPVEHGKDFVKIGETYYSSVVLTEIPSDYTETIIYNFLQNLPFDCFWMSRIKTTEKNRIKSYLKTKKHILQLTSGVLMEAIKKTDTIEREDMCQINEIESAIDVLASTQTTACEMNMVFLVKDTDKNKCISNAKALKTNLSRNFDLALLIDDYCHLENVLSFFPTHTHHCQENHLTLTTDIPFFLPLYQGYGGIPASTPPQFFIEKREGQKIPFSFFDDGLKGGHAIFMGQTGTGKSFLLNWILNKILKSNPKVLLTVLDKGGSYKEFSKSLTDSQYLDVNLENITPIQIFPDSSDINEDQLEKLAGILYLIGENSTETDIPERHLYLIEIIVRKFYEQERSNITLEIFYSFFEEQFKNTEDSEDRSYLSKTSRGIQMYSDKRTKFYPIFNSKNSVSVTSNYLFFELSGLENHPKLQSIYFFLIQNIIDIRMYRLSKQGYRQIVIFDECWSFLDTAIAVKMIKKLYKTARKYGNTIFAISQSTTDFLDCLVSDGIIDSSVLKFFLQLGNASRLEEFGLNQSEIEGIHTLTRKEKVYNEIFVNVDKKHAFVWKLSPTPAELKRFSNDFMSLNERQVV